MGHPPDSHGFLWYDDKSVAFNELFFASAGFTVKIQIPLNPPLPKGDFKTPL
jgi:hypothetical protein